CCSKPGRTAGWANGGWGCRPRSTGSNAAADPPGSDVAVVDVLADAAVRVRRAPGVGRQLAHQRQGRARQHVGADRRGQEQEHHDQHLARVQPGAVEGVEHDRGQQDAAHAHGAGLGGAVQPAQEAAELDQRERAQQAEEAADRQQYHQDDFQHLAHSTISLRITYLLSTTVPKKPSMAMISAASKYSSESRYIPNRISWATVFT